MSSIFMGLLREIIDSTKRIGKTFYIFANKAIVPMAIFSSVFAWFNMIQEIPKKKFVANLLFAAPDLFLFWLIWWCPLPLAILCLFYNDRIRQSDASVICLFFMQLLTTYAYFWCAINGSSNNHLGAEHMQVLFFPPALVFYLSPFLAYVLFRFYKSEHTAISSPTDEMVSHLSIILSKRQILYRIKIWILVALTSSFIFSLNPYLFRPLIQIARYLFGL